MPSTPGRSFDPRPVMWRRLAVAALLWGSGCAFVDVTVRPPERAVGSGVSGGRGRIVQVVIPFAEGRPEQNRCGMMKNGLNMDTANVLCSAPPTEWLAALLAAELQAAGFKVIPAAQASPGAVRIEGTLLQFFVEAKIGLVTYSPEADVHVRLVATSASGLLAERDFYVKETETSAMGTEANFQAASTSAAQSVVKSMVEAVVGLMNRYPELGVEGATSSSS